MCLIIIDFLKRFLFLTTIFLFLSCTKNQNIGITISNNGFIEYQYSDTLPSGKVIKPYKRVNIASVYFTDDTTIKLPDSLSGVYRTKKLILLSSLSNIGMETQPMGSSFVQLVIIDSIKNNYNISVSPFNYLYQSSLQSFSRLNPKRPVLMSFTINLNLQPNGNGFKYENSFEGQITRPVLINYFDSDIYQINAHGIVNNNIYNLCYTGTIVRNL